MPNKSVAANSTWMALGTIFSRITGVIRSAAVIAAIGFGTFADAFSIANSLPTIVYVVVVLICCVLLLASLDRIALCL